MKIGHIVHFNGKERYPNEFKKKEETAQEIALVGLSKTSMVIIQKTKHWNYPSAFFVKSHGHGLRKFAHVMNQR
jgi:hypothetical protein